MAALLVLIFVGLYFLPTILAVVRKNRRVAQIVVINAFLGWTCVAWVLTLAWSLEPQERIEA